MSEDEPDTWELQYGDTVKTFAEWGFAHLKRTRRSQSADMVTFDAPGMPMDTAALFPYGAEVTILRNGEPWFVGVVVVRPRLGSGREEAMSWTLAGPWWYLEHVTFHQAWTIYRMTPAPPAQFSQYESRVILGQDANGAHETTGAVIQTALNYCKSVVGAKFQFSSGDIDDGVAAPWEEVLDASCAEVIIRMLRWTPGAITWFDYSETPPRLYVARPEDMDAVTVPLDGSGNVSLLDITSRDDLVPESVAVTYEVMNQVDGLSRKGVVQDIYPGGKTGRELNALAFTIAMGGSEGQSESQELGTEALPVSLNDTEWWQAHVPALAEIAGADLSIHGAVREFATLALENEVVIGAVPEWLHKTTRRETFTALANYFVRDSTTTVVRTATNEKVSITIITTDAHGDIKEPETPAVEGKENRRRGQIYSRLSITDPEAVPTAGLAQWLYDCLADVKYEGRISVVANEIDADMRMGIVLNLTEGLVAWATMRALVQEVGEDVDAGTVSVTFGFPGHLGPQDFLELSRTNRRRVIPRATDRRDDSELLGDQNGQAATDKTAGAGGEIRKLIVRKFNGDGPDAEVVAQIFLDPDLITTPMQVMTIIDSGDIKSCLPGWVRAHG